MGFQQVFVAGRAVVPGRGLNSPGGDLKVLFVHLHEFGIFPDIYEYCCLLRDAGFDVSYLGTRVGGESGWRKEEGINVCHLDRQKTRGRLVFSRLAHLAEEADPDIAHVFQFRGCGLLPLLSKTRRAKWILDVRTLHIADPSHQSPFFSPLKDKVTWIECQAYSHLLVLTPFIRKVLTPSLRPITMIPLGASRKRLNPGTSAEIRAAVRERYKIHQAAPLILYAGSTSSARQLEFVVEAFARALKEVPEARLMMVGTKDAASLTAVARDHKVETKATFVPWTPYKQVHQFFVASDIGVSYMPLNNQCRFQPPTKLIEYMTAGLVALSNVTPATSQMFTDGVDAIAYGEGAEDLSRALVRGVRLLPNAAGLREEARKRVACLDWESIVQTQLVPLYDQLMESAQKPARVCIQDLERKA